MRIRDDNELLEEFCKRFPPEKRRDKGFVYEVSQTRAYDEWAYKERCKDIFKRAEELMTY